MHQSCIVSNQEPGLFYQGGRLMDVITAASIQYRFFWEAVNDFFTRFLFCLSAKDDYRAGKPFT